MKKLLSVLIGLASMSVYADIPGNYPVYVYFYNMVRTHAPTQGSGEDNGGGHWVLQPDVLSDVTFDSCSTQSKGAPQQSIDIPPHQAVKCKFIFINGGNHDYLNLTAYYIPQTDGVNGVGSPEYMGHVALDLRNHTYFQSGFEYAASETLGTRNHMVVTSQYAEQEAPSPGDVPTSRKDQIVQFALYDDNRFPTDPTTTSPIQFNNPSTITAAVYNKSSPFNMPN